MLAGAWRLWRNYDLTKAVLFLRSGGWRLRGHVFTFRHCAIAFVWRVSDPAFIAERRQREAGQND